MNLGISGPLAEGLPLIPEEDAKRAPQCGQYHVRHDRRGIPVRNDPGRDELAKAITSDVLVDRDGEEDAASRWLI